MAAEYVLMRGNERVVLCGGGVRTFHGGSGTTIDLGAVGVLRRETHLPVVVDPSEWDGDGGHVWSLAPAAVAAGADGVMVSGEGFAEVVAAMAPVALAVGRSMGGEGGRDVGIARHVRAVMGEGVVEGDSPEAVAGATRGVLEALVATHGVTADAVVSAVFTLTPDVAVAFPAAIAREMGWTGVPLLRVAAVPVPGKAKRTVGVLLHVVDA